MAICQYYITVIAKTAKKKAQYTHTDTHTPSDAALSSTVRDYIQTPDIKLNYSLTDSSTRAKRVLCSERH